MTIRGPSAEKLVRRGQSGAIKDHQGQSGELVRRGRGLKSEHLGVRAVLRHPEGEEADVGAAIDHECGDGGGRRQCDARAAWQVAL